ncbi:MAG: 2-C-methyl-D-erythritol 4-phosphate cytidylyltransferase, partial [Bacteroidia bacterium]|nr:2-C-methyl-D-erythritol 4-phosphate cytidylyltransferase [Bacteroidia bacterium]
MKAAALIVAGGSGVRMNHKTPKQYLLLGECPIIVQTIKKFLFWKPELPVMVVIAESHQSYWESVSKKYFEDKLGKQIFVTFGGNNR